MDLGTNRRTQRLPYDSIPSSVGRVIDEKTCDEIKQENWKSHQEFNETAEGEFDSIIAFKGGC